MIQKERLPEIIDWRWLPIQKTIEGEVREHFYPKGHFGKRIKIRVMSRQGDLIRTTSGDVFRLSRKTKYWRQMCVDTPSVGGQGEP